MTPQERRAMARILGSPQVGVPEYGFGPMTQATRAGVPNASMSSFDGPMGSAESLSRALMDYGPLPAQLATELTGVPSLVRGGARLGESAADGDGLGMASGAGEAVMGMLPGAAISRTLGPAVSAAFQTAPRAIASGTVLAAPQTAEAASRSRKSWKAKVQREEEQLTSSDDGYGAMRLAVEGDPELQSLFQAWRDADRKSTTDIKGVSKESGDDIRSKERDKAERLRGELLGKIEAKRLQNAPFRERYPGAAEAIGGAAAAAATALPFANTVKSRLARSWIEGPRLNKMTKDAEEAFASGAVERAAQMQGRLAAGVSKFDAGDSASGKAKDFGKNAALSSLLMFEGSSVPEQVDVLSFAPGHPVRERAQSELTRGDYYQDRVPAAVLSGLLTAGVGTKTGMLVTPGSSPSMLPAARELIGRGGDESIARLAQTRRYFDEVAALPDQARPQRPAPIPEELASQPVGRASLDERLSTSPDGYEALNRSDVPAGAPVSDTQPPPSSDFSNRPPLPPEPPIITPTNYTPRGKNRQALAGPKTPNDAKRYWVAEQGAGGQSQSDIVRAIMLDEVAKTGKIPGGAALSRALADAGVPTPVGPSQINNRRRVTEQALTDELGASWSKSGRKSIESFLKKHKGGKTLALPVAVGAAASAYEPEEDERQRMARMLLGQY